MKINKCKTCGCPFSLNNEDRYMVQRKESILGPTIVYEAFDCPKCGCQNIVNVRELGTIDKEQGKLKVNYYLDPGAFAPERAHRFDAGYDLKTPVQFVLNPDESAVIDTGVHFEIPEGYVGFLKSKSGLNVKSGILSEGVIDSGYQGSIVAKLYNHSDYARNFQEGDKITQIVILPIPDVEMTEVNGFEKETERGNNGFGSTGR